MLPLLPWPGLDLFYYCALAVYLVIFLYTHANRIRSFTRGMADMMNAQTPPRKLFKPSSKTKTPTSAKKQRATTPTPSRTQSHDISTSTDAISRSTYIPSVLSGGASESTERAAESVEEEDDTADQTSDAVKSIAGKPREVLDLSTDELPAPSNPTDSLNSPTDIAKYFIEQGNPEMSHFVSTLTGKTAHNPTSTTSNGKEPKEEILEDRVGATSRATDEPSDMELGSMEELPRDDTLIASPNERTKDSESTDSKMKEDDMNSICEDENLISKAPNLTEPADISKKAEGTTNNSKAQALDVASTNSAGEPDAAHTSKGAQIELSNGKNAVNGADQVAKDGVKQKPAAVSSDAQSDGTQVTDNMGRPAHIERRIEIPLPRPEKVINSPPEPSRTDTKNIAAALGDANDLPGTENLRSTDDLPQLPEDMLQDPPEEILDPSVHSPSSNISPIPKISKITPIGMDPPPDLQRLAYGLGGNVVDDVGNVVDTSGKVLGHATGDLPAMVGRKVADSGEVYGDNGEVIGYVSENFTGPPPPPADIPSHVLGGLKVDHEGNILDMNGHIIGRFNEKAGEHDDLAPFLRRPGTGESQNEDNKSREEKKPKVNAHTGGSPSDIFLDVKSTTDGIQLTIRIPTTFGRQTQDS
ncbi:hypothetical protein GGR54DRAFT_288040 [Hypoxylon sp. NC1633]|nr:hypothetical protein GGR54DRAFT_288040 [Hypoxylon sp. NC1633]